MDNEGPPEPVGPIAGMCGCVGVVIWVWLTFFDQLDFSANQLPGICVDGRLMDQSFGHAVFQVDDTKEDTSDTCGNKCGVIMRCLIDVLVYPCPVADLDRPCTAAAADAEPFRPRPREEEAGVLCTRESAMNLPGSRVCRHPDWTCETGTCDAYEKTSRLCATNAVGREPYSCWYVPGKPEQGILLERATFPLIWLLAGLLALACAFPCMFCMLAALQNAYEYYDRSMVKLWKAGALCFGITAGIIGCTLLLVVFIMKMIGAKTAKGPLTYSVNDTAMVDGFGITYANERPPPGIDPAKWYVVVFIIMATICVLVCLPCLCVLGCERCRAARKARGDGESESLVESSDMETESAGKE